jgi:(2Fe-2S) ferredoxin
VLHDVEPDQRASPTQSRLTVHSDRPGVWLGEVLLTRIKELVNDVLRRGRSVDEDHVLVVDTLLSEAIRVILWIVESDYLADLKVLKDINVRSGGVAVAMLLVALVNWTHEGHKLAGNDPVEISVLHLLVMLVLLDIESLEVVPAMFEGFLEALQTVEDGALVVTFAFAGVAIVQQLARVGLEQAKRMFGV